MIKRSVVSAMCAIRGESDLNVVLSALRCHARIVALAPDAHRVIRAIAAMNARLTALLDGLDIADPALHDALTQLIETRKMCSFVRWWAEIAPAGWGGAYIDALVDGVQQGLYSPRTIAALIGPNNAAAALVTKANDMAWVIRRWGQSTPDAPTAWMHSLSSRERNRLLHAVRQSPIDAASCLPWLPPNMTDQMQIGDIAEAIDAFAVASPFARAAHANLMQRLVERASLFHLGKLTRLACAMKQDEVDARTTVPAHDHPFDGHHGFAAFVRRLVARAQLMRPGAVTRRTCGVESEDVWGCVQTLIRRYPIGASYVVAAAPWNDLAEAVRDVILEQAEQSDICAAVAAAQGCSVVERITNRSAVAFFAALDPNVWDALPSAERRRWVDALPNDNVYLAVRSLVPRPEFLARATLDNSLVRAVQRHTPDAAALCWALLSVALRDLPPDEAVSRRRPLRRTTTPLRSQRSRWQQCQTMMSIFRRRD